MISRASSLIEYALVECCEPSVDRDICLELLRKDENSFYHRKDEYASMLIECLQNAAIRCFDAGDFETVAHYESLLMTQFSTELKYTDPEGVPFK